MFVSRSPPGAASGVTAAKPCTICFDENLSPETDPVETKCGHIFHRPCIQGWLSSNDSCPVCRQRITMSDCRKHTGATKKPYNTRSDNRPTATNPPTLGAVSRPVPSANSNDANNTIEFRRERSPRVGPPSSDPGNPHLTSALLSGLQLQIADLVRQEVARGMQSLRIEPSQDIPFTPRLSQSMPPNPVSVTNPFDHYESDQPSRFGQSAFATSSRRSYPAPRGRQTYASHRRSGSPIKGWKVIYDGNNSRLHVDEFIFRVETLTRSVLNGDFDLLVSNLHILFSERVNDWFWTLLRSNPNPPWENVRLALKADWGEPTNDTDIRRKMLSRRQRPGDLLL